MQSVKTGTASPCGATKPSSVPAMCLAGEREVLPILGAFFVLCIIVLPYAAMLLWIVVWAAPLRACGAALLKGPRM